MLRLAALSVLFILMFSNCNKELEEFKIIYSVKETSADSPSYNISYTSDKSGGTTMANSSNATWNSGTILLDKNQFLSMTVDCSAPTFELKFSVSVNGYLWQSKVMQDPVSTMTISGNP